MNKIFTCYIISETTLGIQCAEVLIKEGCQLLGIISPDVKTQQWASQHNIPCIASIKEFRALTPKPNFDYLFSIVNTRILPKDLLILPRHNAINYHDAPLPKYAGVNATSWAILNQESIHGISWHIMDEAPDRGSIIKQVIFPIDIDETALSLNLKCYTHALESFKELIKELSVGSIIEKKQDLSHRTYFSLHQKPHNFGFVYWNNSAEAIDRQYRALYFGNYPNTLTTFKVLIGKKIYIPSTLEVLLARSNTSPGTIVKISNHGIQISTKTQDILLSHFKTLEGDECKLEDALEKEVISVGDKLKAPSKKIINKLHEFSTNIFPFEIFWRKNLDNIALPQLQFIKYSSIFNESLSQKTKQNKFVIHSEKLSSYRREEQHISFTDTLISAFLIYISRLENLSFFSVGLVNSFLTSLPKNEKTFFPKYVPLTCSILPTVKVSNILEEIKGQIKKVNEHKSYFKDIFVRHPELNKDKHYLSIIIHIGNPEKIKDAFDEKTSLLLNINDSNKSYTLYVNDRLDKVLKSLFKNFPEHIRILFNQIINFPEKRIDEFSIITQKEKQKLLIEWNATQADYPENTDIHHLFEEQVEKTPQNIALVYEDEQLTYQELNDRANQLAHYLRSKGVGPDILVAIAVERSFDMIIGLLGILKAGGAYVPLDPSYPPERLQFMLGDTKAPL
ncbi:MAG: AMP-binding protein, partial [Proteobacteria bacterium]|nr:AMP-binding protein [Pseudomonadota bacterium]